MAKTSKQRNTAAASTVTTIVFTVAALYFAQEVLIPLALATLLAFILAPLANRLQRAGFSRGPAVVGVVAIAFIVIGTLGYVVGDQVYRLAEALPTYQKQIEEKINVVRGHSESMFSRFSRFGSSLEHATETPASQPTSADVAAHPVTSAVNSAEQQLANDPIGSLVKEKAGTSINNPLYAYALPAPVSPIRTLGTYLGIVLKPLGTAGLVIVFVIFMLVGREDLRDRIIRVVSRGKYIATTKVVNDAATRISRYLVAQAAVNGGFGLTIGLGLWVIGLVASGSVFPTFVLWGFLCAGLRFVPYVGAAVAACFPIFIALAVYPGFGVFFAVVGLLVIVELISSNFVEPYTYGASTGLSTVALLLAAVFWTWLWGPIGLLLSTPLTVCIVVLGRHVPQLEFLDVLLGDEPALTPPVAFYQRLLAGDPQQATRVADEFARENGVDQLPDGVLLPALQLTRRDRRDGDLEADTEEAILAAAQGAIVELDARRGSPAESPAAAMLATIVGIPSHHRAEELALEMLGGLLAAHRLDLRRADTRQMPSEIEALVQASAAAAVVVAVMPPGGLTQTRYLCRRLRKRFPELKIVVAYFGRVRNFDRLLVRLRSAGATYMTTTLLQTRAQIEAVLNVATTAPRSEPVVAPPTALNLIAGQPA